MSNYSGKCWLTIAIEFDPTMTSPEDLAAYLDSVVQTAMQSTGPLDYTSVEDFQVWVSREARDQALTQQVSREEVKEDLTMRGVTLPRPMWAAFDEDYELVILVLGARFKIGRVEAQLLVDAWRRGERPAGWESILD